MVAVSAKYIRNTVTQGVAPHRPVPKRSAAEASRLLVVLFAAAAAIGAAFAGCHPTGTFIADPIETAAFAAGFTVITSRSSRGTWLVLGLAAVLLAREWLLVPAALTLAGAFSTVFSPRARRRMGAAIGALGVQVLLRWPPQLFHGFPSLAATVLVVVVGASAWRRSSTRVRRRSLIALGSLGAVAVVVSLPAVIETLIVRNEALAAESAVHAALSDIGGSSATVTTELQTAAAESSGAASTLNSWFGMGARLVPLAAQQDRFLTETSQAAAAAAQVGAREAPFVDYHRLGYHDGALNLASLRAMRAPVQILDRQLELAEGAVARADSQWLLGPLERRSRSFRADIGRASRGASLAVQAAKLLPAMLGGNGTRNYLVAFMTPSESRGYDGFIGSYGLLEATDGRVRLTVSGSIADIELALPEGGATLTGPPDFLARYGSFHPGEFPQDATYAPDLPTVSNVLDQIYQQTGSTPLDGVLALDPEGLAALLHFTGPIQVIGLPVLLTQDNATQVLLTEQYTTFDTGATSEDIVRHDFLQAALHAAFDKLVTGSLPDPKTLGSVLDPVVAAGRISFWSFHKNEEPFLRRLGIDGSFPAADGGDLLALTTQNSGNNKIDAYLHTAMSDQVTFDPSDGSIQSAVVVRLTNDAPASGLPPIVIDSPADPGLPVGTNRTWLSLYSPLAVTKVSVDGAPGALSSGPEFGVRAYSTYVDVPPQATVTVRIWLAGVVAARSDLPVSVRLQPSANPERVAIDVTPVGPWRLTTTTGSLRWVLTGAMRQRRNFRFVPG
jgi:hypothetical protein